LDKHARQEGPGWVAASKCRGGCEQLPAVFGAAAASLVVAWGRVSPVFPLSYARVMRRPGEFLIDNFQDFTAQPTSISSSTAEPPGRICCTNEK
jgi:hypothetical protein